MKVSSETWQEPHLVGCLKDLVFARTLVFISG